MYIYAIHSNKNTCKIGLSYDPEKRLKQLQTGSPEHLKITYSFAPEVANIEDMEKKIHKEIWHKHSRGEWFNLTEKEAIDLLTFASIAWDKEFID